MASPANRGLGALINWFPGHMARTTREIRQRLKPVDLVLEVRDARIPLSSANDQLEEIVKQKRRIIVLNKMDLANPNLQQKWRTYFNKRNEQHLFVSAKNASSILQLLKEIRELLKKERGEERMLLSMVVGLPNVGKSAIINSLHRLGNPELLKQNMFKTARVGPLPGVTREMSGFKISNHPKTYILDTPGVMIPNVKDNQLGLKLALTGAIKESMVGDDVLAHYLLTELNEHKSALDFLLKKKEMEMEKNGVEETKGKGANIVRYVKEALEIPRERFQNFKNIPKDEISDNYVQLQMEFLRKKLKIPIENEDAHVLIGRQLIKTYRLGLLGSFTLDYVPDG